MSTNYYFRVKGEIILNTDCEKSVSDYLKYELENSYKEIATLHIGKRNDGWKPLFKKNQFYSSVDEIVDFYNRNVGQLVIIDEKGIEKTLEELNNELFMWNFNNDDAYSYDEIVEFNTIKDSRGYDFTSEQFA